MEVKMGIISMRSTTSSPKMSSTPGRACFLAGKPCGSCQRRTADVGRTRSLSCLVENIHLGAGEAVFGCIECS